MKKIITAKEQFDKAVKDSNYVDEVCSYDYYYREIGNVAFLFACNDDEKDFMWSKFPTFDVMKEKYGLLFAAHLIENGYMDIVYKVANMTFDQLKEVRGLFSKYCDFLFCNGSNIAEDCGCYNDIEVEVEDEESKFNTIGAEHTDINAFSSMINHIKKELIGKIEGMADCLEIERFAFNPRYGDNSTFCTYCIDGENFFFCKDDDVFWFENEDGDSLGDLDDCVVEELLHLYSKLHK